MEGDWMTLEDFLADNQLTQALAPLRLFGSNTAKDVRLLKDEDVERMQKQEEQPLKKLTAKKLKLCLEEWRIEQLDMAVAPPSAKPVREAPREFKMGIQAADYVSKWYRCQIVGYDTSGMGGTGQFGASIRQTTHIPPGGFRFMIHYEGWSPKWDEFVVLPSQANRLKELPGGPESGATGNTTDPAARLGRVYGLKVTAPGGGVRNAAAAAIKLTDTRAEGQAQEGWTGLELLMLLVYEDGSQEWIDLAEPAERERLVDGHKWTYPSSGADI